MLQFSPAAVLFAFLIGQLSAFCNIETRYSLKANHTSLWIYVSHRVQTSTEENGSRFAVGKFAELIVGLKDNSA